MVHNVSYHVLAVHKEKLRPKDVSMEREFLDVFSEDVLRLPPDRKMEFTIELLLGTTLIS